MVSPELVALDRDRETRRYEAQEPVVSYLADHGHLKDDLTPPVARDVLWALTGRDLYRLLVRNAGGRLISTNSGWATNWSRHSCGRRYIQHTTDSSLTAQRPDLRLHATEAWMDALAKALLPCDTLQERRQLRSLGAGERPSW